jgi:hypothetical protein
MTQANLQEIDQEMKQVDKARIRDEKYRPQKSMEPKISVGELYGCLCHQAFDGLPALDSRADQD